MAESDKQDNPSLHCHTAGQTDSMTAGGVSQAPLEAGLQAGPFEFFSRERIWKVVITSLLFFGLFHQEIIRLVQSWGIASESHGMLIPAFSLYFLYQQRDQLKETYGRGSYCGLAIMVVSLLGYLYSYYTKFGYPRPVMMIFMIAGIVIFQGGWKVFRLVWLPIFFLLFAIKLPAGIHEGITMPMRTLASSVAATILNFFPGVDCEASNVLIHGRHLGETFDLNVAEACSGMRLLRAFVALGVAMAYLERRPLGHRIVLLLSTVPIAILCNIIRVLLTGLVHIYIGPQYAQGTLHTIMGLVMLFFAFGLYGFVAWILTHLFLDDHAPGEGHDVLVIQPDRPADGIAE